MPGSGLLSAGLLTLGLLTFGLLGAGLLAGCSDSGAPAVENVIKIQTGRFFPNNLSLTPGSRVRWVNTLRRGEDSDRTVTSIEGPDNEQWDDVDVVLRGFESGNPEGEDYVFRFDTRGTYTYRSRLPEGEEFTGIIRVQ